MSSFFPWNQSNTEQTATSKDFTSCQRLSWGFVQQNRAGSKFEVFAPSVGDEG